MSRSTADSTAARLRILVAKPGLDGHDRGALVIARALRNAGHEVIYSGRRQQSATIAEAAVQEDVDVVGLSILSGAHVALVEQMMDALRARNADDIPVVVGGTVLKSDEPRLRELGVAAIFPTGSTMAECVAGVERVARGRQGATA